MKKILEKYCLIENQSGLLLLSMPTGFGKTHNVLDFIYENYHKFKEQGRKIIFITNLKKNLPCDELKERFIKGGKEKDFEQNFLFIDSNSESVIEHLFEIAHEIDDGFKNETYEILSSKIETLKQLKTLLYHATDYEQKLETEIRVELEPKFRKFIQEKLDEFKTKQARLSAIKKNKKYQWIGKLYPAVFTDDRTILFMSVDKFFVKNSPVIESSYYFSERLSNHPLIFIDEFDATKERILNQIIESGLQHKIDFLDLFLNIHNHLMYNECSQIMVKQSKWQQDQIAKGKKWRSPTEQINEFKIKAHEVFIKYQLQKTCKSHEELAKKKKTFLFYDYQFHYVLDALSKQIKIIDDETNNTNWIKAFEIKDKENNDNLGIDIRSLLLDIRGFLTYFQQGIKYLAENYFHKKNEDEKQERPFSLESSVRSVLNHFRLDEKNVEYLISNIMGTKKYDITHKQRSIIESFYDQGFRYHNIVDDDNHDTLSRIFIFNFSRTPESFLAEVCEKAMVVGISATANLTTKIGNYDLEYLAGRLQDSFIKLPEEILTNLKKEYVEVTKGYEKINIKPQFIGIESDLKNELMEKANKLFIHPEYAQRLWNTIEHKNSDQDDISYLFNRYIKALTAWKYFIDNPDCYSFLCFFNKFPKSGDSAFDLDILKEYAGYILENAENKLNESISDTIFVLTGDEFEDNKDTLLEDLKNNKRRFIISTYQTIGAGQNLQFDIPSSLAINLIHINDFDFPQRKQMDINGIYLDAPTHLLVNINEEKLNHEDFIKYIFQLEFLQQEGAISPKVFKQKLNNAFARYINQKRQKDFNSLYNTDAYSGFVNRVILQALGRICRTNLKCPTIHILADSSIKKHLAEFRLPKQIIPVREYQALLALAGESMKPSKELETAQNKASYQSNLTMIYIRQQLNKLWTEDSIKLWQNLRQQVLRQPVIINEANCDPKWKPCYVELYQPSNYYSYYQENDYQEVEVFFSDKIPKQYRETIQKVNHTRLVELMKIQELDNLFTQNNWMTEFPQGELMLTPPMFNNIYKGALGEAIGKYIVETYCNLRLQELDVKEFELFDYKIDRNIYIDFKCWDDQTRLEDDEIDRLMEKINTKMQKLNAKIVFIINILASPESPFIPIISNDQKIIQIPYLCQNGQINFQAIDFIKDKLRLKLK
jgi:hypothetical protein